MYVVLHVDIQVELHFPYEKEVYLSIKSSGGPLSVLKCCVNVRLLSGDKLGWELGVLCKL